MMTEIDMCDRLCSATGGHIEDKKSACYAWKQRQSQGQKIAVKIKEKLYVNGKELKQTLISKTVKSLSLHVNPTIEWIKQFEMIKEKLL